MQKTIWTCWFQGRSAAPDVVKRCIASWEEKNPGWKVRCLDGETAARYAPIHEHVDLAHQSVTAASLSDILRLLLLKEYGGVWVDATVFCNRPLDDWLPEAMGAGFFAFANPAPDRLLASWFLAAEPGNALLLKWTGRAMRYWRGRQSSDDYFWVHHQFGELCAIDADARRAWNATPRISADGPHSLLSAGLYAPTAQARSKVDRSSPVYKLTHRLDSARHVPGTLAHDVVGGSLREDAVATEERPQSRVAQIASLKVSTKNVGDHIQIIAGQKLLERIGYMPEALIDRDHEIAHPPAGNPTGILLNGWFKTNPAEWPPHADLAPVYLGFHIRLFQSPTLVDAQAIDHYQAHGPVGARDRYTEQLLRDHGVEAFHSNCLTLTFPRRLPDPAQQTETFIVSRDRAILKFLPTPIRDATFITHYTSSTDFEANMARAAELLASYRDRAKLIVTTMLHCALPAIAMGIPVVVFMPPNEGPQRTSDGERFSSLREIIRVFEPSEAMEVDWNGYCVDVGRLKLELFDRLAEMCAERWGPPPDRRLGPIAPASALPLPSQQDIAKVIDALERRAALLEAEAPDRVRWRVPSSYKRDWDERAALASSLIPDAAEVFEIGVGVGNLRALLEERCRYVGADLAPLDTRTVALDLDRDPLPDITFDHGVMLGVLEYLHHPHEALAKIAARADTIILSYCCARETSDRNISIRRTRGWANAFTAADLMSQFAAAGFQCDRRLPVNTSPDFEQFIFRFRRTS